MSNSVRVSATFSFRGETHRPEMMLDLDVFLAKKESLSSIYPMLANANGINAYSYEYEILEMTPLHFDQPTGLVTDHVRDGQLDLEGFRATASQQSVLKRLEDIAMSNMSIAGLDDVPGLRKTLLTIYALDRK